MGSEDHATTGLGERLPVTPDAVLFFTAGLFAVTGIVATTTGHYEPLSELLFQAFMNVGLALLVLAGTAYLRRTDLPRPTRWNVVSGYLGGVLFIGLLLVWAYLPDLRNGTSLLALREQFVFFGNLGGLLGFVAGVSRANSEYNRRLRRELEARQQDLERQLERLDEFAGIVSHDLRNPLSVAQGHLRLLEMELDDEEQEDVRKLDDALDRMDRLIDDLLDLARAGEQIDELRTVSLSDVARSAWCTVDTREADLHVDVDGDLRLEADESRLTQLFENLFRNAVEHAGDDATVRVGVLEDGRGFYVADDGPGIPADEREDVFDAGYSTAYDGTGFGLSIVAEIVDAHGWTVAATESESGGARFEITGVDDEA